LHELSIAMEVIDIVRKEAATHGASSVTKVCLLIGDLSGVETDSLAFCFDAVKNEHSLTSGAELVIEKVPVRVRCEKCDDEFRASGQLVTCPSCGGYDTKLVAGTELEVKDLEVE
jgi:hydrogenase nickel incorporation protein HypA/HybF